MTFWALQHFCLDADPDTSNHSVTTEPALFRSYHLKHSCTTAITTTLSSGLPFQAGPGLRWRQSSLLWALFFICSYSTSLLFIQSIIVSLCLPRVLVPSILPSKTVHRRDSLLNTWPNQFFCLCRMVLIKLLFSSTMCKTSWLDQCSVQLIFINLLQIHISNDYRCWMSTFLNVHVSAAYNTVLQIRVFTILFFNSNFILSIHTVLLLLLLLLLQYKYLTYRWVRQGWCRQDCRAGPAASHGLQWGVYRGRSWWWLLAVCVCSAPCCRALSLDGQCSSTPDTISQLLAHQHCIPHPVYFTDIC